MLLEIEVPKPVKFLDPFIQSREKFSEWDEYIIKNIEEKWLLMLVLVHILESVNSKFYPIQPQDMESNFD